MNSELQKLSLGNARCAADSETRRRINRDDLWPVRREDMSQVVCRLGAQRSPNELAVLVEQDEIQTTRDRNVDAQREHGPQRFKSGRRRR